MGSKLSYEHLEVGDGSEAQAAVNLLLREIAKPSELEQIVQNLLTYCRQDTLAMVEPVANKRLCLHKKNLYDKMEKSKYEATNGNNKNRS